MPSNIIIRIREPILILKNCNPNNGKEKENLHNEVHTRIGRISTVKNDEGDYKNEIHHQVDIFSLE